MTLINSQTWEHLLGMALEGVSLTRRQMQEDALDASLLPRAYAHCSAISARHSRSSYVVSSLLPPEAACGAGALRFLPHQ